MQAIHLKTSTVGELAANLPGASRIFRKYKIDFCCGGKGTIEQSVDGRFVTPQAVIAEIEELCKNSQSADWENTSSEDMIAHILKRFHEGHREDLSELILLAKKVEAVHGDHPLAPKGLALFLTQTQEALIEHMLKEENVLFPAILSGNTGWLDSPIHCMRDEHEEHGERLSQIEALCHQFELPSDACATWRALYTGTQNLISEIMAHVNLENHVLFNRYSN